VLAPSLFFLGLEHAPASDVALLVTAEMVFTGSLAAVLLRERLSRRAWAGLLLLMTSAVLVAGAPAAGGHSWLGAALVLLATMGWAVDNVVSTPLALRYPARAIIAVKGLTAGGFLVAILAASGPLPAPSQPALLSLLYTGTLGLGASAICFYGALPRIGPTLTASIQLPGAAVVGAGASWLLLGERLGAAHAAAVVLLLGGAILLSRAGTPRAETAAG
jgi:drug/metabolite transporter (DMT)-like permease